MPDFGAPRAPLLAFLRRAAVAVAVLPLLVPALASADDPPPSGGSAAPSGEVPAQVERVLGGNVTELANGIYKVRARGGVSFTTHGPDFNRDVAVEVPLATGLGPGNPERPPVCATDHYQEVLYAYPSTGSNELAAKRDAIRAQIRRNNFLLNQESLASGGLPADLKVRCHADGAIRVSAFPVTPDLGGTAASFSRVVSAAKAAGYGDGATDTNVDYTIFYEGAGPAGACGVAAYYFDASPDVDNPNNNPAGLEAGYGATYAGCWFGQTSMHETAHSQGAVQPAAPNSTGSGGHCNERADVMCYVDGGDRNQTMVDCPTLPSNLHFDCGWNTYFDSAPEPGEWLATHWNLGSGLNRFIDFSAAEAPIPDTTIIAGPGAATNDSTPTFSFESDRAPASFFCRFDSEMFAPCSGPGGTHTAAIALADGPHAFEVRAIDAGGTGDFTPDMRSFTIDTQAPETRITTQPGRTVRARRAALATFAFTAPEAGVAFECGLDNAAFAPCSSPSSYRAIGPGPHRFLVRAVDAVGNVDPSPAAHRFKVKRKPKRR